MAAITVVVPIYKVESYLRTCFESLLKQEFRDFIVMAVNDGSPDRCQEIIDEYTEAYPQMIHGIRKENGGYGSVLQLAIREMDTPYFLICDPDDTLAPNALKVLYETAQVSGADITIGAKNILKEGTDERSYDCSYNADYVRLTPNTVYNAGTDAFNDLLFINPSPHAKLYRRTLAEKIEFPTGVGYTDNLLFYISLLNSRKIIYTDLALADYLIDRTGNTMTDISRKAMSGQIAVFRSIARQAEAIGDVPGMFWYRMFESFKFMLYESRRLNCPAEEYGEVLDELGEFLAMLVKHGIGILPFLKRYSRSGWLEKRRDRALLKASSSERIYASIRRKMKKEFVSK